MKTDWNDFNFSARPFKGRSITMWAFGEEIEAGSDFIDEPDGLYYVGAHSKLRKFLIVSRRNYEQKKERIVFKLNKNGRVENNKKRVSVVL